MTDGSDSVVAREQFLQGLETVFPIEVISEIAPLCVGVVLDVEAAVYTGTALSSFQDVSNSSSFGGRTR